MNIESNQEFEALCARLLPKFNEYLRLHSKNIFSCELATSLDGIKSMPALYDLNGVRKQVIAPLSLLTKDVDTEIAEAKKATAAANTAAGKAYDAAASVTKATTDLTAERKKVEDAVNSSKTQTAAAQKATADTLASKKAIEQNESARQAAEQTRQTQETARKNAETTRNTNEETRKSQETARQKQETARVEAEKARAAAEQSRANAESSRVNAENKRKTDTSTAIADAQAKAAAAQKAAADTLASKTAIEQNESARQTAEQTRQNQESTRQKQEAARVDAEKKRVAAENGRASAEAGRVKAESKRQTDTQSAIDAAKSQTSTAKELCEHPTKAGENGNWWMWNLQTHQYEDTGIIARGGAMYPSFRQRRNKLLMIDYGSHVAEHVSKKRNKLVIKV